MTQRTVGSDITVLVVMGVSGSGKTTLGALLAGELGWDFAEADDFHPQANVDKMIAGVPLTDEDRWPWLDVLKTWIDGEIARGRRGVVTCSALKKVHRDKLYAPGVVFVHMDGSKATIAARLGARTGHFMPPSLLDSQLETLEPLSPEEDALVVDLDKGLSAQQEADEVLAALHLPA
jgi:carbohydrate kinase (thermoresistant glucokinase family)